MISNHHTTHCCIIHGCKYCEEDCPVATGKVQQEYSCEDCESFYRLGLKPYFHIVSPKEIVLIKEKYQKFVVLPKDAPISLGQIIVLDICEPQQVLNEVENYLKEYCVEKYYQKNILKEYDKYSYQLNAIVISLLDIPNAKVASIELNN